MKKILAILLSALLVVSMVAVFAIPAAAEKETITVDGDLTDNGWDAEGWTSVTPENGYWQNVPEIDTLSYKYQLRADDTKLYVAVVADCALVEGGNGSGTNIRLWVKTNDEATVYTHFFEVHATGILAKACGSLTVNTGTVDVTSDVNMVASIKEVEGKTYAEFSVDLAEFNGTDGFDYYICVSNKAVKEEGAVRENVCLYYPAVEAGESRLENLPYENWDTEKDITVVPSDIALEEIPDTSDDSSDDSSVESTPSDDSSDDNSSDVAEPSLEEELAAAVGAANEGAEFDLVLTAPETYKAGDEITISVAVKNITSTYGVDFIKFEFYYDNTKLELTNDINEGDQGNLECIDLSGLPKSWENFTIVNSDFKDLTADDLRGGAQAKADNDGFIDASAFTTTLYTDGVTADDEIVFNFTFVAKTDATGDIGAYIPNASVQGGLNETSGLLPVIGNAGYVVIAEDTGSVVDPSSPDSSDDSSATSSDDSSATSSDDSSVTSSTSSDTPVQPGDASNMIIFAIVALVAIAGSAVVIKTRR